MRLRFVHLILLASCVAIHPQDGSLACDDQCRCPSDFYCAENARCYLSGHYPDSVSDLSQLVGADLAEIDSTPDEGDAAIEIADGSEPIYLALGDVCGSGDACDTGLCVDGVCCESACDGPCVACDVAGQLGTCSLLPRASASRHGACTVNPLTPCQNDGTCDGRGACAVAAAQTSCGTPTCVVNQTLANKKICDGFGACKTLASTSCAPYICQTSPPACAKSCTNNLQCSAAICSLTSCGKIANGRLCSAPAQCSSGFCVDGVCCSSQCQGQCQACNLIDSSGKQGTCTTLPKGALPRGNRPACTGEGTACEGSCGGVAAGACSYPDGNTTCGASCSSRSNETDQVCNGAGGCTGQTSFNCAGQFACVGNHCKTSCSRDADCQSGAGCLSGICQTF